MITPQIVDLRERVATERAAVLELEAIIRGEG
jgi:hypothetical protein